MTFRKLLAGFLASAVTMTAAAFPAVTSSASDEDVPAGYTPIHNIEELYAVRNDVNGNYILMNDIDMTEDTAPGGDWDINGTGWEPIGTYKYDGSYGEEYSRKNSFKGTFDGNGHAIIGMNIHGDIQYTYVGLFGYTYGADIKNVKVIDADINVSFASNEYSIDKQAAGAVVGFLRDSNLNNCLSTGEIRCVYDSDYTLYYKTGGVAGYFYNNSGEIQNCYNAAKVSANKGRVGGIAGDAEYDGHAIRNCYNTGEISSDDSTDGGYYSYTDAVSAGVGQACCEYCYYLNGTCEGQKSVSGSRMGLSVAQLKSSSAFTGWDFENTWVIDQTSSYKFPQLRSCMQIPVTSVSIVSEPERNIYAKGDKLDLSGGKISVYHESDKTTGELDMTENMLGKYSMEEIGKQSIPVIYIDKSAKFEITVNPAPVSFVKISGQSEGIISLSWEKQSGISGYYVYKRASENDEWTEVTKVKDAKFTDDSENADTEAVYAVSSYLTIDGVDYIGEKTEAKNPADFTLAEVRIDDIPFDYETHIVEPEVIYNGKLLTEGKDYDIVSGDYEVSEPGRYKIVLKGKNGYEGTVTAEFSVACYYHTLEHDTWGKCSVCGATPFKSDISYAYVEYYDLAPAYEIHDDMDLFETVTYDGCVLEKGVDYIIPWYKVVRDGLYGKYTYTIEGIGCFEGEQTVSCMVYCIHNHLFGNKSEMICKDCGALRGDANQNKKVDLNDAILVAKYMIDSDTLSGEQYYNADFNKDAKVNLKDAIAIVKYMLSKI